MERTTFRRILVLLVVAGGGASLLVSQLRGGGRSLPEAPTVLLRIREVSRLETLDVSLYKKVDFTPQPPSTDSFWGDVFNWARHTLRKPRGRAVVFADVHFGYDLSRMGTGALQIEGERVRVTLPPVEIRVALRPGETEIIDSNLDSQETTALMELAKEAFEREAQADPLLQARARSSAERSLQVLLLTLGFREVVFDGGTELSPLR